MIDVRLFEQCVAVYSAMDKDGVMQTASSEMPSSVYGNHVKVYTGFTTYLIESLGLTISNYTPIMRRLQTMGCIKQLQRGGRGIPSQWVLLKAPTERDFSRSKNWKVSARDRLDELEQRVTDIEDHLKLRNVS